jgi:inorganic pyrophosphatase
LEDFEKHKPGRIEGIKDWFITYKTYDGKPKNSIFDKGRLFGKEETLHIIQNAHKEWRNLNSKSNEDLAKFQDKRKKFKLA